MKSFIAVAVAALATSVAAAGTEQRMQTLVKKENGPSDVQILNYALTLEHLEKNFYFQGLDKFRKADFIKAGYSAKVHARVQQIAIQEKAHVTFLAGALGSAAVGQCKYDFGAAFDSVDAFVATARVLEGVGTAAYLGAAPDIDSDAYLLAAGSVLTVEARHTSYLNEVNGETGFPTVFDSPLNYAQVFSLAAPFIIPGTCGNSGAGQLPPSIQAFPKLNFITRTPRTGHTSAISFPSQAGKTYYVAFINGGATVYRKVEFGSDGVKRVDIPSGLDGVTYLIVTTSPDALADNNTVAGPAYTFL